ncbi:MAG: hypothetical protein U5Q44_04535 [Dehalococcoidia bacterium]|nr:hypothetical protein [Dehalococcoidia bacterium]
MSELEPLAPTVQRIISVLALALLGSIAGLVVIGVAGGDPGVRATLTHITETLIGVFIGIAAARLASR